MIKNQFSLDIPVFVISKEDLEDILHHAPEWWGNESKEIYDNLIFAIASHSIETVAEKIGEPTEKIEKVQICGNAAFWSFDRKLYAKANWWKKTAVPGVGEMITIRTANTLRKIAEM